MATANPSLSDIRERRDASKFEPFTWLYHRNLGLRRRFTSTTKSNSRRRLQVYHPGCHSAGHDYFWQSMLGSIDEVTNWNPSRLSKHHSGHHGHGGIFNFDFSTDGSILAAACERKSFLLFDPFNGSLIGTRSEAHSDCVNCIRFLDERTFVTCSDDTTVSLWDVRNTRQQLRVLRGHSNWVKNIEYAREEGLLVTSGFDGSVYTWEINRYSEQDTACKRVFHTNGLMRSKLTPDSSKLIISTAGGYLMIISNLDLRTLHQDLLGFKPNMYRLMQMSQLPVRLGYMYNHLFKRHRNRVELVSDFPVGNDAEVITSLQVHPQGWAVLSRNTSSDGDTEWSCIHDIQAISNTEDIEDETSSESSISPDVSESQGSIPWVVTLENLAADDTSEEIPQQQPIKKVIIHNNEPRLTHYIMEANVGRGFIKELCFSNDGRLVCSPHAYGTRLMSFNKNADELCDTAPNEPVKLHELTCNISHSNWVVSTKFSPTHCMYVSGCLNGKVSFHQPVL